MAIKIYLCIKCGWEWCGRKLNPPKQCPHCWSTAWAKNKDTFYGWHDLRVGQAIVIPWRVLTNGARDEKNNQKMNRSLSSYAYQTGKIFWREATPAGLKVTRKK